MERESEAEPKSQMIFGNYLIEWSSFPSTVYHVGTSRKKWSLRCFLETGSVEAKETWAGSLFQTPDAVDENDLEATMDVFQNGADIWLYRCGRASHHQNLAPTFPGIDGWLPYGD